MTSKECLKWIAEGYYLTEREHKEFLNVIEKDLDKLEELENENLKLKETVETIDYAGRNLKKEKSKLYWENYQLKMTIETLKKYCCFEFIGDDGRILMIKIKNYENKDCDYSFIPDNQSDFKILRDMLGITKLEEKLVELGYSQYDSTTYFKKCNEDVIFIFLADSNTKIKFYEVEISAKTIFSKDSFNQLESDLKALEEEFEEVYVDENS